MLPVKIEPRIEQETKKRKRSFGILRLRFFALQDWISTVRSIAMRLIGLKSSDRERSRSLHDRR